MQLPPTLGLTKVINNIQVQIEKLRNVNKLFQEYSDLMSKIGQELKNDT